MIGVDEGKTVSASAVRVLMVVTLISCIMLLFVSIFAWYNGYFTRQVEYKESAGTTVMSNIMQENPMPVHSLYTALSNLDEREVYFVCITYPESGAIETRIFSHEENDPTVGTVAQEDLDQFRESIEQQFGVTLTESNYVKTSRAINAARAILHKYDDRICEVYYNPAHTVDTTYFPPYLYIVVHDRLAGV